MAIRNRDLIVTMDGEREAGEEVTYTVQLRLGDQTRAELEAKRMGMKATDMPINLQALFAWSAMVRLGHYDKSAKAFLEDCVDVADSSGSEEDVDPTQPTPTSA